MLRKKLGVACTAIGVFWLVNALYCIARHTQAGDQLVEGDSGPRPIEAPPG